MKNLKVICMSLAISLVPIKSVAYDFKTDFSRGSNQYRTPHRYDTTRTAASRSDGVMTFTIQPGMHGAGNDAQVGSERAEYGIFLNDREVWVRQTFRVRAVSGFPTNTRTLIAQIKYGRTPSGLGSPPIAVYMSEGGAIKCNDYSSGRPSQDHRRMNGVRLDDGQWHTVIMDLVLSDTRGYCRVVVDGRVMIEQRNIDSHANGSELVSRIGPYRDAMPATQVIQFDDWTVQSSRKVPAQIPW